MPLAPLSPESQPSSSSPIENPSLSSLLPSPGQAGDGELPKELWPEVMGIPEATSTGKELEGLAELQWSPGVRAQVQRGLYLSCLQPHKPPETPDGRGHS